MKNKNKKREINWWCGKQKKRESLKVANKLIVRYLHYRK